MNDWEKWRERVRDIRASSTTWWWWWWWWWCLSIKIEKCFSVSFACHQDISRKKNDEFYSRFETLLNDELFIYLALNIFKNTRLSKRVPSNLCIKEKRKFLKKYISDILPLWDSSFKKTWNNFAILMKNSESNTVKADAMEYHHS